VQCQINDVRTYSKAAMVDTHYVPNYLASQCLQNSCMLLMLMLHNHRHSYVVVPIDIDFIYVLALFQHFNI
jgi:hypothetical protein